MHFKKYIWLVCLQLAYKFWAEIINGWPVHVEQIENFILILKSLLIVTFISTSYMMTDMICIRISFDHHGLLQPSFWWRIQVIENDLKSINVAHDSKPVINLKRYPFWYFSGDNFRFSNPRMIFTLTTKNCLHWLVLQID